MGDHLDKRPCAVLLGKSGWRCGHQFFHLYYNVVCGSSFSRSQPDFEGFLRALRFPPSAKLTPPSICKTRLITVQCTEGLSWVNIRIIIIITRLLAEVSYLVVCISWSFHGYHICCLRQPRKYYENTNGEKVRTGYTFIGFALLCFQTVTSCPLRGLFSIGSETKQLSYFPFKFTLFNNHNSNKNNNIFSFTKFSKLYNLTSRNYNPKFKLHAV